MNIVAFEAMTPATAVGELLPLGTLVLNFILEQPLLATLFAGSLVGVACYVISKVKKTAKH